MDLRDLYRGCIRVEESAEGFLPLRFSPERLKAYQGAPTKPYSRCPAGVRMAFITGAEEISFISRIEPVVDGPARYDIWENGSFAAGYVQPKAQREMKITYRRACVEASLIEIFLPVTAVARQSQIQFGAWRPDLAEGKKRVLALGDSIFQGLFGEHPSLGVIPLISKMLRLECLNLSVGGDRIEPDWLDAGACKTDYIIVALGTNDWAVERDFGKIKANIPAYFDRLSQIYPCVPATVISPPWMTDIELAGNEAELERFNQIRFAILDEARRRGYQALDGWQMIPHEAAFFADHAHPNDLGFSQYAINLARAVGERLK